MAGPTKLFDRALLDARRRRALARPQGGADFLAHAAVDDLVDRLAAVKRSFSLALDLATPLPMLAERLVANAAVGTVLRLDRLAEAIGDRRAGIVGDPEFLPLRAESLDLVASALALQWIEDLPGALAQIRRALKPDGLFIANLIGGETLRELRESFAFAEAELTGGASPRVAPFAELRDLGALLQRAGFALPVIDQDRLTVRYASALELMRDLRAMGAGNALVERSRRPLRRDVLMRTAEVYTERFADADGRIRATFDIVSLSGWAPHESQQRPLRPGSAKTRLADALGVAERPAGEKAGPRQK
jgi:SAM-dependent methyltransferase